jgi:hypothetical protein
MIRRFLLYLRQKPKPFRDNVAVGVAVSFTAVVALIWSTGVPERFETIARTSIEASEQPIFSQFSSKIGEQLAQVKQVVSATTEGANTSTGTEASPENNSLEESSGEEWRALFNETDSSPQVDNLYFEGNSSSTGEITSTSSVSATSSVSLTGERVVRLVPISTGSTTSSSTESY